MKYELDWRLSKQFTTNERAQIELVAEAILQFVDLHSEGGGQAWMRHYLGGVRILRWPFRYGIGLPGMVYLPRWWQGQTRYHKYYLAHELGHVWDARSGRLSMHGITGGVADALNEHICGTVGLKGSSRFARGSGRQHIPQHQQFTTGVMKDKDQGPYGNNATADYLAESFALSIYYPEKQCVPQLAGEWLNAALKMQAKELSKKEKLDTV